MAFKLIIALAFVTVASAALIPAQHVYHGQPQVYHTAPVQHVIPVAHQQVLVKHVEEYDTHPKYKFGYSVDDKITGDSKSHFEERDGDVVHGEYSLIDADGYKRIVKYTADAHNGFNAVVQRIPLVKVAHAIPVAEHSHFAPVPQVAHYSPNAYYHH